MMSLLGQYDVITSQYDVIDASVVSLVLCLLVRNGLVNKVEFLGLISQKW